MNLKINSPKKKILILPSWYPSEHAKINGSFFQEQAKLIESDFDVKVIFIRFKPRPAFRKLFKKTEESCREWISFLFYKKNKTSLPNDEIFSRPPLIEYQIRILGLTESYRYKKKIASYLVAFDDLITSGWKPDLIHAHSVNIGGIVANRIKEKYSIPYIITEHNPFSLSNYPEYMRNDIKKTFNDANTVLSLSYDKVRQVCMSEIDIEPNLIFNFVDETIFNKITLPYRAEEPLKLISIGAASHLKDHRTLLLALKVLKNRNIPFKLTLVGLKVWGGLYDQTLNFIKDNNLENQVDVVDQVERNKISEYLISNNVYVMTSIAEGFPVSVLEAMASGLFIIATRHGGTEDILTKETGTLVEIKNYIKIADELEAIYFGNVIFDPMVIRNHVISICGKEAFKTRLLSYYKNLIDIS